MPPDTTGGAPIAPTQQTTAPTQAPMTIDQLQGLIQQNAGATAQDIQNEPTVAAQQRALIFGNDPTLTSLQTASTDKIQELFAHDQWLSQQYGAPVPQAQAPNPNGVVSSAPADSSGAPNAPIANPTKPGFGAENPLAAGYVLNPYEGEQAMATRDATTMKELNDLQNEAQQRRDVLGNVLDNVMNIYKSHLDTEKYLSDTYQTELNSKLAQADQARQQRAEALAEAQSGYQYNPKTGTFGIMGLGDMLPGLSSSGAGGATGERAQMQAIVSALPPQSPLRVKFEQAWQQENGTPLFPNKSLATTDTTDLNNALTTLQAIDNVTNAVKKYGQTGMFGLTGFPGGIPADIIQRLAQNGIDLKSPDEIAALNSLTQLQGLGDRELIGGRLTGYLLNVLGPAFPGPKKGSQLNEVQLANMRKTLLNGINSLATHQGYDNAAQMLRDQGMTLPSSLTGGGGNVNRASMVSNLKSAGYSDDEIHAYLRAKGIDG